MNSISGRFGSQLDGSFITEEPGLMTALDQYFPDNLLYSSSSVATDTDDLPVARCSCSTSSVQVRSTGVDTSDLSSCTDQIIVHSPNTNLRVDIIPPSPIMTPPVTPMMDNGGGNERFLNGNSVQLSVPEPDQLFPDLGADVFSFLINDSLEESMDDEVSMQMQPTPWNEWQSGRSTPPRPNRIYQAPRSGFATPAPRAARRPRITTRTPTTGRRKRLPPTPRTPKTPSPAAWVRKRPNRNKEPSGSGGPSPQEERRKLRPTPKPTTRYMGDNWFKAGSVPASMDTSFENGYIEVRKKSLRTPKNEKSTPNSNTPMIGENMQNVQQSKERPNSKEPKKEPVRKYKKKKLSGDNDSGLSKKKKKEKRPKTPDEEKELRLCDTCRKAYTSYVGLRLHTELVHLNIRYRCKVCGCVEKLIPNMGGHFKRAHPDVDMKTMYERFSE